MLAVGTGADEYRLITFIAEGKKKKWKVRSWADEEADRKREREKKR